MSQYKIGDKVRLAQICYGIAAAHAGQLATIINLDDGDPIRVETDDGTCFWVNLKEIVGLAEEAPPGATSIPAGDYDTIVHPNGSIVMIPKPRRPKKGEVWEGVDNGTMVLITDQMDSEYDPWCVDLNGDDCGEYEVYVLDNLKFAFPSLHEYLKARAE